jgi:broad specificity phosphatase PhoE
LYAVIAMNQICLVRHGETDANRNMIVQGRIDNPLNANGIAQAEAVARHFLKEHEAFDMVVSSPLVRASETARIIARDLAIATPVEYDPGFIERDFGAWDGRKIDADYAASVIGNRIPRMERHEVLEARVNTALRELCQRHPGKRILVVTHSHVIKAMLVTHLPPSVFHYASYLSNCSANHLVFDGANFTVVDFNVDTQQ